MDIQLTVLLLKHNLAILLDCFKAVISISDFFTWATYVQNTSCTCKFTKLSRKLL